MRVKFDRYSNGKFEEATEQTVVTYIVNRSALDIPDKIREIDAKLNKLTEIVGEMLSHLTIHERAEVIHAVSTVEVDLSNDENKGDWSP